MIVISLAWSRSPVDGLDLPRVHLDVYLVEYISMLARSLLMDWVRVRESITFGKAEKLTPTPENSGNSTTTHRNKVIGKSLECYDDLSECW